MVAAANADGAIDVEERQAIVAALADAGLSGDESAFIDTELSRPQRIELLAPEIRSRGLAEQAFTVALLAIDVDTDAERAFLERFQELVQLDDDTVRRISASTR